MVVTRTIVVIVNTMTVIVNTMTVIVGRHTYDRLSIVSVAGVTREPDPGVAAGLDDGHRSIP